jgi:PAS domain S-box-containing protein
MADTGRQKGRPGEDRFRVALRNSPVCVFTQDADLRYTWIFNPVAVRAADVIGKSDTDLVAPEEAARLTSVKRAVLESGHAARGEIWLTISGAPRCYDYWFEPLRDAAGRVCGISCATMDVTETARARMELQKLRDDLEGRVRERTEELRRVLAEVEEARRQLSESDARYRGLSENTQDIHYIADAEGVVRYVGPQVCRYGWTPEQVVGRGLLDFVAPRDRPRAKAEFAKVASGGQGATVQLRFRCGDGSLRWFEEASTVRCDPDGRFAGLTGVLRDITERKRVEEKSEQQRRQLRRLAAKLAAAQDTEQRRLAQGLHDDVAQLLMAVGLKVGMVSRARDEAERSAMLRDAERLLGEANAKVRSLSFEFGSSVLYSLGLTAALTELCRGMEERYGIRIEARNIESSEGLDRLTAGVLFKSARELLFNVVKHAGVREASLALEREDSHVKLTVEDQGKGFAVSADGTARRTASGIGLFQIRERLAAVGGSMAIESVPGVRTRIILRAPFRGAGSAGRRPRGNGSA